MNSKRWQVTRLCCTDGTCLQCRFRMEGKKRVVQVDHLTEASARRIALGWTAYEPKAEPMCDEIKKGAI